MRVASCIGGTTAGAGKRRPAAVPPVLGPPFPSPKKGQGIHRHEEQQLGKLRRRAGWQWARRWVSYWDGIYGIGDVADFSDYHGYGFRDALGFVTDLAGLVLYPIGILVAYAFPTLRADTIRRSWWLYRICSGMARTDDDTRGAGTRSARSARRIGGRRYPSRGETESGHAIVLARHAGGGRQQDGHRRRHTMQLPQPGRARRALHGMGLTGGGTGGYGADRCRGGGADGGMKLCGSAARRPTRIAGAAKATRERRRSPGGPPNDDAAMTLPPKRRRRAAPRYRPNFDFLAWTCSARTPRRTLRTQLTRHLREHLPPELGAIAGSGASRTQSLLAAHRAKAAARGPSQQRGKLSAVRLAALLVAAAAFVTGLRVGEAGNPGPSGHGDGGRGQRRTWSPDGLPIVSGNGSGWGTLQNWMAECEYDVMCVQEHKLTHQEDIDGASTSAHGRGWKSFWAEAVPSQHVAEGPSGGTAVMVRKALGAYDPPGGASVVPGHCAAALIEAGGAGGLVVYSVYLRCGEDIGAHNWSVLCKIAQHARGHGRPWAMGGDWNCTPNMLAASGWTERVGGVVITAPVSFTTTRQGRAGRLIDFFVVSKDLASLGLRAHIDGTAPIRTHSAVGLVAPARPRSLTAVRMHVPRRFPTEKPIGPRKAPGDVAPLLKLARGAMQLATEGRTAEATAARELAVRDWLAHAEAELVSEYHLDELPGGDQPFRGRASGPKFVREPLLGEARLGRHSAAGAENRRLRLAQDRANELEIAMRKYQENPAGVEVIERARAAIRAGHHIGRAAPAGTDSARIGSALKAAARRVERSHADCRARADELRDHLGAHLTAVAAIRVEATDAADLRENQSRAETRRSIAEWCREAEANGAGIAHRWAQVPVAWRPETVEIGDGQVTSVTSSPDALVAAERDKWAPLWAPAAAMDELPNWGVVPMLPRPTVKEVRAVARRFRRKTGQGADRLSPRDLADLDDAVLEVIIELMTCCEALGTIPDALALVIVVLLRKKEGGRRPIGLLPALYRLWAKVRQPHVRSWELAWDRRYLAAARGKSTSDVAWLRALRAEYASGSGATAASVLWDLKKCYEHGRHVLLATEARELNFPLAIARVAVAMYTSPRRLTLDGAFAEAVKPSRGFIAGCSNALAAIKATMIRRMDSFILRHPRTDLDMFVDDLELQSIGTKASVPADLIAAVNDLSEVLEGELGYPLAEDKAVVVANDDDVCKAIVDGSNGKAGTAAVVTSKLGIEFTSGRRRPSRGGPRRARYRRQLARRRRVGRLRKLGCKVTQVIRRGLCPAATYGSTVHGVSDHEVEILSALAASATSPSTRGTSRTLKLALGWDPAIEANAGIMHYWAAAVWRACGPVSRRRRTDPSPALVDAALKKAERELETAGNTWSSVRGPAGAAVLTARRMGWRFLSGFRIADDQGGVIDMGVTDPRGVRAAAERATCRSAAARAAAKLGLGENTEVWMAPIRRALHSTGMACTAKAALRRAFSGGFWSKARRATAGLADDDVCDRCGVGPCDAFHCIWECSADDELRGRHTTEEMRRAATEGDRDSLIWTRALRGNPRKSVPPPRRDHDEHWYFGQGIPEDRHFEGDVYTDGSALHPQLPDVRRAGWAVVQLRPDGTVAKALYGHVPAGISVDQTVASGEVYALRRAAELATGTVIAGVDYQGILDGCRAGEAACDHHRRPNATSWRAIWRATDGAVPSVRKIKAHRSRQEAAEDPDPNAWTDWLGNRAADSYAKRGARCHFDTHGHEAAEDYAQEMTNLTSLAKWIGTALAQWPRAQGRRRGDQERRRALAQARLGRRQRAAREHGHSLSYGRDGWHCLTCGRSATTHSGARRLALSQCRGHTGARIGSQGNRPSAHTLWAAEAERSQTGHLPPDVVWCGRCGAYSSARVYHLGKACRGVPEKSARTRLAAFNRGIHPTLRHRLAPPVRLTDEVIGALAGNANDRRAAFNMLLRGSPTADERGGPELDAGRGGRQTASAAADLHADDEAGAAPTTGSGSLAMGTRMEDAAATGGADFGVEYVEDDDVFGHGFSLDDAENEPPAAKRFCARHEDHGEVSGLVQADGTRGTANQVGGDTPGPADSRQAGSGSQRQGTQPSADNYVLDIGDAGDGGGGGADHAFKRRRIEDTETQGATCESATVDGAWHGDGGAPEEECDRRTRRRITYKRAPSCISEALRMPPTAEETAHTRTVPRSERAAASSPTSRARGNLAAPVATPVSGGIRHGGGRVASPGLYEPVPASRARSGEPRQLPEASGSKRRRICGKQAEPPQSTRDGAQVASRPTRPAVVDQPGSSSTGP